MRSIARFTWAVCFVLSACRVFVSPACGAEPRTIADLEFAFVGEQSLKLDLYLPAEEQPALIVWVHGGAWRAGSKSDVPASKLLAMGYAVASVDYRLSPVAPFPAQAHDIKAAIRFLRAKADSYGYDPKRIAIAGSSAGGHLAAIVGVTNGVKELEGTVGGNLDRKSDVQAIVSLYGASNLTTILSQSKPQGLRMRVPALQLFLGGQPTDVPEIAKLASPVAHLDAHDPPLLLIHGEADPQMPPEQSTELAAAYRKQGLAVTLEMIPGAVHGGPEFYDAKRLPMIRKFLDEALR
ncbi:MAG: alpha/beta hydrolase [Planctomycetia bacterium]|nr:alpha/beta hydrolase [Planctomycetia bacterium]